MTVDQGIELAKLGFELVKKVVETVEAAKAGKVDPAAVQAKLTAFHNELVANDAAADKALHDKFHPGETGGG